MRSPGLFPRPRWFAADPIFLVFYLLLLQIILETRPAGAFPRPSLRVIVGVEEGFDDVRNGRRISDHPTLPQDDESHPTS